MPGTFSDALTHQLLAKAFGATDFTPAASYTFKLFTSKPTDAGGSGVELSGGSYAGVAITNNVTNFPAPASRQTKNGTAISFTPSSAAWVGTGKAWALYNGATLVAWGWLYRNPKTVTVDASTDVFTSTGHGMADGLPVVVDVRDGSVPSGLAAETQYYIRDSAANTFKLTATPGGAAIDITAVGSGQILVAESRYVTVSVAGVTVSIPINELVILLENT